MQTLTLASIYELQGLKEGALEVYKDLLKKNPNNQDALFAIGRLSGNRKKFNGVNEEMKNFFVDMNTKIEYLEFERWLINPWN